MKRLWAIIVALCLLAAPAMADTAPLQLVFNTGGTTGAAANIRVVVTDAAGTVLLASTNTPDGTHSFAESSVIPGLYYAPYTATFSAANLPLRAEFTVGGSSPLVSAAALYLVERGSEVSAGYTSTLAGNIGTTNSNVTAVKVQTDKLQYDGGNNVRSAPQTAVSLAGGQNVATIAGLAPPANWPNMGINAGDGGVTVHSNLDKGNTVLASSEHTNIQGDAAAGILVTPSQKLATDISGSPILSAAVMQALRDVYYAKIIDGSIDAQGYMVLSLASIAGDGANTFNATTHVNTATRKRQDHTTPAYATATQYGASQTALPATATTTTVTTPLH